MVTHEIPQVFLGLDVGKSEHWACAITSGRKVIWNKALPNDEAKLVDMYTRLQEHGPLLVVVDQPATIGALAVAVAQHMGVPVAYLPGLTMRRIADLYPGDAKTDEKDAFIIADAARSLPHTLRELTEADIDEATLGMLTGFDLDLSRQVNQVSNRIRGLFTQIHPALEKVLGLRLEHDAILEMLATWPTPEKLRKAGRARIDAKLKKHGARRHAAWTEEILTALAKQTVTVTGTQAAGIVIPHLARQLIHLHAQRADVAQEVEKIVVHHPLYLVLTVVCQGFWTVWLCDLGHMCCLLFPCLCWGLVSQRGVGTDPVVEDFDVLSDFMAGKVLIDEDVVVIHLVLQGREKRFSHSVIPADSDCSHGLVDPMFLAVLVHLFRTILAAVVTVEYDAFA